MLSRLSRLSAAVKPATAARVCVVAVPRKLLHTSNQSHAPVPRLPETGGKVRLGFVPEELFQFLYPKIGVTGPYTLGLGLLTYLLSKELYIINNETFAGLSMAAILIYIIKKYGKDVAAYADKLNDELIESVNSVRDVTINNLTKAIENEKKEQWCVEGRNMLFDAKKNNVALLLETNMRERLHHVVREVKRRLDYQLALQHMQRRTEQEHMITWVERGVMGSITPQQDKDTIAKCIADLKVLSKTAQARA
ncbi:ATP synthase peripheral stalk subunit b, mitochondrial [Petromyzon marinus]|uniref:ATP synthase peripheral stalk subunit b, mitochondrial n=1 Tax=Petromyzon marinus TaxID=7757 RepID=UPI003F719392